MDNDTLIDQARRLYAKLHVEQHTLARGNKAKFDRLDRLTKWAYSRYQRRLNRCALCYQYRSFDCSRFSLTTSRRRLCPLLYDHSINHQFFVSGLKD